MSENKQVERGDEFVVKVTGVNVEAKVAELKEYLNGFTTCKWVNLLRGTGGKNRGTAYVTFAEESHLNDALKSTNATFQGEALAIERAEPRTRTERPRPTNTKSQRPARKNTGDREERQPRERVRKTSSQRPREPRVDVAREESNTVFVGNMSFSTTEESLSALFSAYGTVKSARVIKYYSGKSKGFGYVEFETVQQANAALKVNGQEVDAREVKVDISTQRPYNKETTPSQERKPRKQQPRRTNNRKQSGDRNDSRGQDRQTKPKREKRQQEPRIEVAREESTTLFVGNMSWSTTEETLKSLFSASGNVRSVRIIRNYNGNSKGFGYVEFDSHDNVQSALNLNGKDVDGRELKLDVSTQKPYEKKE